MAPPTPDVSVVIVHYETPLLLAQCLDSLARASGRRAFEVWVVDNASAGFEPEKWSLTYPTVHFLRNEVNAGFAGASNRALRLARGRYLLLLNPDTTVAPDTLSIMTAYMDDHPDIGCATCRLELEDGSLDLACRRLFPTPMRSLYRITLLSRMFPRSHRFGQYNLTYLDDRCEAEIDTPCGAFMMVRDQVAEEVGLLDERYFMYGEDVDWSFRIKRAGWRIVYTPITTVKHLKRGSSREYRRQTVRYFHDGMRRFYRDHYASEYPRLLTVTVLFAITAREQFELAAVAVKGAFPRRRS